MKPVLNRDVLAQHRYQQSLHPDQQFVQIDDRGHHDLLAAEGQQLTHQARRAATRHLDLGYVVQEWAALLQLQLHQFRIADDGHQQVVEIVGDAAGELANGIHLLCLAQLQFQALAFGQVPPHDMQDGVLAPGNRCQQHFHWKGRAVRSQMDPLEAVAALVMCQGDHLIGFFEREAAIGLVFR